MSIGLHKPKAHLVGSYPAPDAEAAMRMALTLCAHLLTLPDGETGARWDWVRGIIERLREHPDLEVAREGDWADYTDMPQLRLRKGHRLRSGSIDLGYAAAFEQNWPTFCRLRDEAKRPDLAFQVGVPGDLDLALFALGPVGAPRHRGAFTDATLREIRAIHEVAGPDVVFQLELPAELVAVTYTPRPLRPLVAAILAGMVHRLVRQAPHGARFGVHLCVGDWRNEALVHPRDAGPLVSLTNALTRRWPAGRALDFVHVPFAAGERPPPSPDRTPSGTPSGTPRETPFYAPLTRLRLPDEVRLVAGIVHEGCSVEELRLIRDIVEWNAGRRVDLAAACGLGRRTPDAARIVMAKTAALLDTGGGGTP